MFCFAHINIVCFFFRYYHKMTLEIESKEYVVLNRLWTPRALIVVLPCCFPFCFCLQWRPPSLIIFVSVYSGSVCFFCFSSLACCTTASVIRLMLQFCKENNLTRTFETLRDETQVSLNCVDSVESFVNDVHEGRWDAVLAAVVTLQVPMPKLMDLYEQVACFCWMCCVSALEFVLKRLFVSYRVSFWQ